MQHRLVNTDVQKVYRLHVQGLKSKGFFGAKSDIYTANSSSAPCSLKMETAAALKRLSVYHSKLHHIPKDKNLHHHRCDNLISCIFIASTGSFYTHTHRHVLKPTIDFMEPFLM
jgi:hypothetical protein